MPPPINAIDLTMRAWDDLVLSAVQARLPNFQMKSFGEFFASAPRTAFSPEERRKILNQSRLLFSNFYAHAPFKRDRGLPDPLLALDEVGRRVDMQNDDLPDDEFHRLVRLVFVEQEDAHTFYGLPEPYADALAFLPFQVKRCFDTKGQHFIVSKLMSGFAPPSFRLGAEITGWSGLTFGEALRRSGRSEVGGNPDAFVANALTRMTLRPLRFAERPDCAEELIEFLAAPDQPVQSILIPWGVGTGFDAAALFPAASPGCAEERATFGYANLLLMNPQKCLYEQSEQPDLALDSTLPQVFEFHFAGSDVREGFMPSGHLAHPGEPDQRYGYLRIKSFQLPHAAGPVESVIAAEFARILGLMADKAPDGLILDIRGNMGGSVRAAETMLQMVSPEPITPARFHWRFTAAVQRALAHLRSLRERFAELSDEDRDMLTALSVDYGEWLNDDGPESTADRLTAGRHVTNPADANEVGQVYQGAVVLLVDAFTYSAGDIFAGGFQDHAIGPLLGISKTTGGGGATKWNYPEFSAALIKASGVPLETLPPGVTISMAVLRSSRVHAFEGQFIEDVGVHADEVHAPTRDDVLFNNRDLMLSARTLLLAHRKRCRLRIVDASRDTNEIRFHVTGEDYASLRYFLDDAPIEPLPSSGDEVRLPLLPATKGHPVRLAVFGCDDQGKILVNARANFPSGGSL